MRGADPFRVDIALAAGFLVAGLLESAFVDTDGNSRAITAVVCVFAFVPLAWMRRKPLFAIGAFVAVCVAQTPLDSFFFVTLTAPFVAVLLLVYLTGRHADDRRMWLQACLLYGGIWLAMLLDPGQAEIPADLIWIFFMFTAVLLAGRGVRSRVLLQREMREKAERHEAERDVHAARAVEDERNRIAAELQAVVANGVSAMVVQAETVPRSIAAGDTAGAGDALRVVEETGRDALAEMRRLLGVLRREGEGPALAPQPSLDRAPALVEQVSGDGLVVALQVEGQAVPLSSGVDLAAYRVLQEALHWTREADGTTSATVSISYDDRDVRVTVRDDRAGGRPPDSTSIQALRDRVGLYGGVLRTSPGGDGVGFKLEARLPHEGRG